MAVSYKVKRGNIFGRVAQGFAEGFGPQLTKEMEHKRLNQGLRELAEEADKGNLSPAQFLAKASGTYGATPQMVQSFGELARQQGISQGFKKSASPEAGIPQNSRNNASPENKADESSITKKEPIRATIENYIPRTLQQLQSRAGQLQTESPGIYPTADAAFQGAVQEDRQNQAINQAQQNARNLQKDVQDTTRNEFAREKALLGIDNVPGDVLSKLEKEAVAEVRDGKLSEADAGKKIGQKAKKISNQYADLKSLGGLGVVSQSVENTNNQLENLQKRFDERDDLKNMAQKLISDGGYSNELAYASSYPVHMDKGLNGEMKNIPDFKAISKNIRSAVESHEYKKAKSLELAEKLAPYLKKNKNVSMHSIGYELRKKDYDPDIWKQYVTDHQDELNLSSDQLDELNRSPSQRWTPLNDFWLRNYTGIK